MLLHDMQKKNIMVFIITISEILCNMLSCIHREVIRCDGLDGDQGLYDRRRLQRGSH